MFGAGDRFVNSAVYRKASDTGAKVSKCVPRRRICILGADAWGTSKEAREKKEAVTNGQSMETVRGKFMDACNQQPSIRTSIRGSVS